MKDILTISPTWILHNRRFLNVTEREISLISYVTFMIYILDCNISMFDSQVRFLFLIVFMS